MTVRSMTTWRKNAPFLALLLFVLLALIASIQAYGLGDKTFSGSDLLYTHYNNYQIFAYSFEHLIGNLDLYIHHPSEHYDLYKYSPLFALFFGLFAKLPTVVGLTLWNLLNALVLAAGIRALPQFKASSKHWIFLFLAVELMTSLQNSQSNALIAGLFLLSFSALERRHYAWGTLAIVLSIFIKLFGLVAFSLFLLYPNKLKLAKYTLLWLVLGTFLPLLVVSWDQLLFLYESWGRMLSNDHATSYGFSVVGWTHSWFGFASKLGTVALGVVLYCLPLLRWRCYNYFQFRTWMWASMCLWVIIFNHKAESPTFIIAMAGVALWFFVQERQRLNQILLFSALLFTSLIATDIFPPDFRGGFAKDYVLKAVPCILIWAKISIDLLRFSPQKAVEDTHNAEI